MTGHVHRSSALGTVLLALLSEEPMHAYRMQRLIRDRNKDDVVNVARSNSIYQALDRLRRAELIRVLATHRADGRPDRTVYEITDQGRATLRDWLHTMLATPAREFPEFPAALATLSALTPDDALTALVARADALAGRLAETRRQLAAESAAVPRLFLVEDEYRVEVLAAELRWVRRLVEELRSGELTWSKEWLASLSRT
jgi:DNA-binding PadR family transcriptional regulator